MIFSFVMIKPLPINLNDAILIDSPASLSREAVAPSAPRNAGESALAHEKSLFAAVAGGDESAFREVFRMYSPLFSYIIQKVTGDASLIPDYLQDAFLKIWLNRDQLITIHDPRKWAMQIVYRLCFNHLKHKQVQQKHADWVASDNGLQRPADHNAVEKELFHKETAQALKSVILQLPPQTQKVYRLSREEQMDIQQIAECLKLSPQTVKNTLCRGIKMIRMLLKEKGIFLVVQCLLTLDILL